MNRNLAAALSLTIVVGAGMPFSSTRAEEPVFMKPIRLQADGADINTGEAWGHSGPALADVDGDGKRDLVVGEFRGKFHFYRNVGTDRQPKYTAAGNLPAGDADAQVPIYCCIGSSPFFVDFDDDGKLDFISGSYDPGECYLFRGLGGARFAERETLVDKTGKPILRKPDQQQKWESFGSWPVMVDWNNDGKLDLLIGGFDGTMFVHLNEGTREKPQFATDKIVVQAAGKELKVDEGEPAGHAAPAVTDWDGDGRWDILSGCDNGGVYLFRNVGELGAPAFADPVVLIAPHDGTGYDEILEIGAEPVPGIRTQIAAVDYDGNGKTDLLVGDFCTTLTPRGDLTAEERQKFESLRKESTEQVRFIRQKMDDLRADFKQRYPGDKINSEEADAAWQKAYKAMRESEEYKAYEKKSEALDEATREFLVKPDRKGTFNDYATTRGYVWLFERK